LDAATLFFLPFLSITLEVFPLGHLLSPSPRIVDLVPSSEAAACAVVLLLQLELLLELLPFTCLVAFSR